MTFLDFTTWSLEQKESYLVTIKPKPWPVAWVIIYERAIIEVLCSIYGVLHSAEATPIPEERLNEVKKELGEKKFKVEDLSNDPVIKPEIIKKILAARGQDN